MTSLSAVAPALRSGRADAVQACKGGDLAEPATNVDFLEVASTARGKDLSHGARVEFVNQATNTVRAGLEGVSLEGAVLSKGRKAAGRAPLGDDGNVVPSAGADGRSAGAGRGGSGGLSRGSRFSGLGDHGDHSRSGRRAARLRPPMVATATPSLVDSNTLFGRGRGCNSNSGDDSQDGESLKGEHVCLFEKF